MYKRRVKRTVTTSPGSTRTLQSTANQTQDQSPNPSSKIPSSSVKTVSSPVKLSKAHKRVADEDNNAVQCKNQASKMFRFTSQTKVYSFIEFISSCGFEVDHPDAHMLSVDQGIFLRDLKSKLEGSMCGSSYVTEFLEAFEEYCGIIDNFKKSLKQTKSVVNSKTCRTSQDSLIHLLLPINYLQKRLMEFLCEKLVLFVCSDDQNDAALKDYPWTQMILRQFKFLEHVVDPEGFLTMLFDVLDSIPDKGYILFCLPEIIQDSQHEDTAKRLSELLMQDCEMTEITSAILDALSNLNLTFEVQRAVSENVLKWVGCAPLAYLPKLVRFLVTTTSNEDMPKIVSRFRSNIDFWAPDITLKDCEKESAAKSCMKLTMEELKLSVMVSKPMAEAWLSAIKAVQTASEHRPIDLVMLLVLHAYLPSSKAVVQALFRAKSKALLFREKLIITTFELMLEMIKEYHKSLIELLFSLLKSSDPAVVQHASCWYKQCLLKLPSWQSQAVVQHLILHVGTGNAACQRAALQVLSGLASEHLDCLVSHHWRLQVLLDKVLGVDLEIAEMILEILCRVAFGHDFRGGSTLDGNVLMFARKHLCSSRSPEVRQKGVVGAILAAKHMVSRDKDTDESLENINDPQLTKQAIQLMELVTASIEVFPDATGLFLDKLSSVLCSVEVLEDNFLVWITDYIGKNFEQKYVTPIKELTLEDDLKLMLSLDKEDAEDVCIPIAQLVNRETFIRRNNYTAVVVMHSSLRLVRCVKYLACEGSLADIAALLTCPVVMPVAVEQENGIVFSCPQEQNFLLDCLFHCVNWLRELVSAFAFQKDLDIHKAVLLRLRDLVQLENKLANWLYQAIDYTPPPCQFYAVAKPPKLVKQKKSGKKKGVKRKSKSKKGKKKARCSDASENGEGAEEAEEKEESEPEEEADPANETESFPSNSERLSVDLSRYRGFLREMDVDVLILLRESVQIPEDDETTGGDTHEGLSLPVLLFLLQDLKAKVEHLLAQEEKRFPGNKPLGFANLQTFDPHSFARNTIKLLPTLCNKLEAIGEYCQKLLNASDNIRDAPSMFPDNSADVKRSYSFILQVLAGLFNWSGFESKLNANSLKDALKILVARRKEELEKLKESGELEKPEELMELKKIMEFQKLEEVEKSEKSAKPVKANRTIELVKSAVNYLHGFIDKTLVLSAACSLVKLMSALCRLTDDETISRDLAKTCKNFISQRWFNLRGSEEKGAEYNKQVDYLIKVFFNNVPKLQTVSSMVSVVYKEIENFTKLGSKDWSLDAYPTITKSNFSLLFRAMCHALAKGTEEMLEVSIGDARSLKVWEVAMESLKGLSMITRYQSARVNLISLVKNTLRFLKFFLKRGIPLCGRLFKIKLKEVSDLLHTLQKSTRFLNSVCLHIKAIKDKTLVNNVPALRKVLEQIVVDVRCMLSQNNCRNAFWVGVLKNKNLKGEEVLSQASNEGEEDKLSSDEEKLPSDDDSDVDVNLDRERNNNARDGNEDDKSDEDGGQQESSMSEVF